VIKHKVMSVKKIILILFLCSITAMPYLFLDKYSYGNGFSNSFYESQFLTKNKVMVVVPHEDDEINLAGSTIRNLTNGKSEVTVVFITNGDKGNKGGIGDTRINEAINSLKVLGVRENNIIFLGYGDTWNTSFKHIYHAPNNEVIKSFIGRIQTYGTKLHSDFSLNFYGNHSLYTRNNYKENLKDVILKYQPDTLIAVDFDSHQDHRAASLIFEEALGEILKEHEQYKPLVYKGFAYNTAWNARDDSFKINMESTVLPDKVQLVNQNYELDTPSYNWEDRVRFPVPKEMLSYTKRSNLIFEALSKHKSQNAKLRAGNLINSDQVFWERDTKSITYDSEIIVSTGEAKYINDFKLIDCTDITQKYAKFNNCVWVPNEDDSDKSVKIVFDSPKEISSVVLYDNFSLADNILNGQLIFSDGSKIDTGALNKNGSATKLEFDAKKNIKYVQFKIEEYEGARPGLCEFEVYENEMKSVSPHFIKIMLDNDFETFIYRYIITNEKEIPLNVYSYPRMEFKDLLDAYRFSIIDYSGQEFDLEGKIVKISDSIKPGKCKIRVELISNPKIFDQVEFVVPSRLELLKIKGLTRYEMCIDFVEEKFNYAANLLTVKLVRLKKILFDWEHT
jgi:LmbE family N-acetylglucosaminyl deacetylase